MIAVLRIRGRHGQFEDVEIAFPDSENNRGIIGKKPLKTLPRLIFVPPLRGGGETGTVPPDPPPQWGEDRGSPPLPREEARCAQSDEEEMAHLRKLLAEWSMKVERETQALVPAETERRAIMAALGDTHRPRRYNPATVQRRQPLWADLWANEERWGKDRSRRRAAIREAKILEGEVDRLAKVMERKKRKPAARYKINA